jgi:hypothetical protein
MQKAHLRLTCRERPAAIWRAMLGVQGLCTHGNLADLAPGDRFAIETAVGDILKGSVTDRVAGEELELLIENMHHSVLRLRTTWDPDAARTELEFSLDAAGVHHDDVESFELRWRFHLRELFRVAR